MRGGHPQKLHAYTYGRMVKLAMEQIIRIGRVFVEYLAEAELVSRLNESLAIDIGWFC